MTRNAHIPQVLRLALLGCALGLAVPAAASEDLNVSASPGAGTITRHATVSYADLNLASDRGVRRLEHRIARAAAEVCDYIPMWGLRETPDYQRCHSAAVSSAKAKVQELTADARRGRVQTALSKR